MKSKISDTQKRRLAVQKKPKRVALTTKTLCMAKPWSVRCPFCSHTANNCERYNEELWPTTKENLKRLNQCKTDFPGIIVMTAMEER